MNYLELKEKHQKEVNDFPLGFCFSDKQAKEMFEKWGLSIDKDMDKISPIGYGGYIRKADIPAFNEMNKRHRKEMKMAKKDDAFLIDGFMYEMGNHEYIYSQDDSAVLACLGMTLDSLKDGRVKRCYLSARDMYMDDARKYL